MPSRKRSSSKNTAWQQILIIGFAAIALTIYSIFRSQPESKSQIVNVSDFPVLLPVPSSSVPDGTDVKNIRFIHITFSNRDVPKNAITSLDEIAGAVSNTSLLAGEPIRRDQFSFVTTAKNPVIEKIPLGMRAMTIKVDATSAVEGWAGSGAIVDVLLITSSSTKVIAEQVKILSAERVVAPIDGEGTPNVPSTVTILVSQEQCLAINTAASLGKLAFALRSTEDSGSWVSADFNADKLKQNSNDKRKTVGGYLRVNDKTGDAYTLSNEKWVKTESIPEGFLASEER